MRFQYTPFENDKYSSFEIIFRLEPKSFEKYFFKKDKGFIEEILIKKMSPDLVLSYPEIT